MLKREQLRPVNKLLGGIAKRMRIRKERNYLKNLKKKYPQYFKPVDPVIERQHIQLWSKLHSHIELDFLRYYCNLSGVVDHRQLPKDIYSAIVERSLNDPNYSDSDMDKNRLQQIVGTDNCPKTVFRRIRGHYYGEDYRPLLHQEVLDILKAHKNAIIIKPAINSYGGKLVNKFFRRNNGFVDSEEQIIDLENIVKAYGDDFIVQDCIKQHPFTAQFNPSSVNTIRTIVYRSVKDENVHIISVWFRMGMPGKYVDNISSGGINLFVEQSGNFTPTAVAKTPDLFTEHPHSGIVFDGLKIPHIETIKEKARSFSRHFPRHRILALDLALTDESKVVLIEVNLMGIFMHQRFGGPMFKEFTEEVVEYCAKNKDKINYSLMRI